MTTVAIVPAAGSGQRLKLREKKPFVKLGGIPLVAHTLKALNSSGLIDTIIVATQPSSISRIKKIITEYGISKASLVTRGGKTRSDSVRNCFKLINKPCDIVLIHDAARPFLSKELIKDSIVCAKRYGACIAAIRQTDTVKLADDKLFVKKTLDRDSLWRAQTPQVFKYNILKKAFSGSAAKNKVTDDASLLEYIGKRVKILEGSPRNMKITTREDLKMAEVML